jgi:MFS transporter, PAT family, beta-lactamase induction signal transducer AmpG
LQTNKKHPLSWIPSTWFAMGLPFVAISNAVAIMYKSFGISDTSIAFWTSLILLPYTLKPLWAPFLEMYKTRKFFVYTTQIFTGVLFGLCALSLGLSNFYTISICILAIIGFSGATHDIAADGVYLNELDNKTQAQYVGWQGAFYNTAKIVSGGVLVYLAGVLEKKLGITSAWTIVLFLYAAIMVLFGLYNMRVLPNSKPSVATSKNTQEVFATLKDVIVTFFEKKHIWYALAFIVLYRFAEAQAVKITPLFFKALRANGGLALSTEQVGLINGVFGSAAFVLGSIASGYYVAKKGLTRSSLLTLCAFFNVPFLAYTYLAIAMPTSVYVIGTAVAVEYFGYGFGFVGLILFIMQQVAPGKYKMAHYAFAGGLMNLGFMLPSMVSGWVSDMLGYKEFFIWVLISTIPSFLITWLVPLDITTSQNDITLDTPANN